MCSSGFSFSSYYFLHVRQKLILVNDSNSITRLNLLIANNSGPRLLLAIYPSYFTLCTHVLVLSKFGLKLNDNKTKLMLVTTKLAKHPHNPPSSLTVGNAHVPFKQSVKNFRLTSCYHFTIDEHFSNIAQTCMHRTTSLGISS